jgi:hypothetical protein
MYVDESSQSLSLIEGVEASPITAIVMDGDEMGVAHCAFSDSIEKLQNA